MIIHVKKANWELFQDVLSTNQEQVVDNTARKTKAQIDQELEDWFIAIDKAIKKSIPITEFKVMPHPRMSEEQKLLQFRYKTLKEHVERLGWTPASRETSNGN